MSYIIILITTLQRTRPNSMFKIYTLCLRWKNQFNPSTWIYTSDLSMRSNTGMKVDTEALSNKMHSMMYTKMKHPGLGSRLWEKARCDTRSESTFRVAIFALLECFFFCHILRSESSSSTLDNKVKPNSAVSKTPSHGGVHGNTVRKSISQSE